MAACRPNVVRVKLHFDYPPPTVPHCRMTWLLLDLNRCRVLADVAGVVRDAFGFSCRTALDLFLQDCYLPPSESAYLLRDDDVVRVKVSGLQCASAELEQHRKRGREKEKEENDLEEGSSKAPSKRQKHVDGQVNGFTEPIRQNKQKKKKKKKKEEKEVEPEVSDKSKAATKSSSSAKTHLDKSSKKALSSAVSTNHKILAVNSKPSDSSDSSDSSDEAQSKPPPPKPQPKPKPAKPRVQPDNSSSDTSSSEDHVTPAVAAKSKIPKIPPAPKPTTTSTNLKTPKTQKQPDTDSDSSSSSSSPASNTQAPAKRTMSDIRPSAAAVHCGPGPSTPVGKKVEEENAKSSDSDSNSEIELVIKRPDPQGMGLNLAGLTSHREGMPGRGHRGTERGRGRGRGRGNFGKARGTPWKQDFHYSYENGEQAGQSDTLTNTSSVLQNPPEAKPKRDYSVLPLLAAPPAVGQKIAFKLLELTESYTPEVSDYKEGKITGFNPSTNMLELELLSQTQARTEPGKFDLVYQNPDGSESVEYAVTQGSQLTERWASLLEPRLIVETSG